MVMNADYLSKRLLTVARYVPQNSRLLDVGSDHAYLPVYLAHQGIIKFGVASEVAEGPYQNMVHEIKAADLISILHPRLANGLLALRDQDRVNVITIAGMGGQLITEILENGLKDLKRGPRLILQPNVDTYEVRKWLMDHHYQITHEQIISDHHHIYEIVVADHIRLTVKYSLKQLFFGPLLLKRRSPVFVSKWQGEANHLKMVVRQMQKAKHHRPVKRIQQLLKRIKLIKQVIS